MENISNKGTTKVGQALPVVSAPVTAPVATPVKSAPADATRTDSVGPSEGTPAFSKPSPKVTSAEASRVGKSLTALAKADAPAPGTSIIRWLNENNFTSGGRTQTVEVPNVTVSASGVKADFIHITGLTQVANIDNQAPFEGKSKVTRDEFDQAEVLTCLNAVLSLQAAVGIDNAKLLQNARNSGVYRTKVNGTSDLNAFFIPTSNDVTTGTNNGKWHLGSDDDVVEHETNHSRLDKQNPDMFGGQGGGFHEGWGDFCAALHHRNGNLSEDFGAALGTPGEPLRNLVNNKTLAEAGDEVHDQGEVYGGAAWSVALALAEKLGGNLDAACDALQHVALKVGFYFHKSSPSSGDIVTGWTQCTRDSLAGVLEPKMVDFVCDAIRLEGIKRGMVSGTWKEAPRVSSNTKTKQLGRALTSPSTSSLASTKKAIYEVMGKRADCEMVVAGDMAWKNPVTGLTGQKQIFQLKAVDPKSHKKYPVKDGYMSVIASGSDVLAFSGGGKRILEKGDAYSFDFTPIPNVPQVLDQARAAIDKFIKSSELDNHQALKRALVENQAHFFSEDGMQVDEVMFGGKLCLQITSDAGEFVYDHRSGKVTAHRLAFVDYFEGRAARKAARDAN